SPCSHLGRRHPVSPGFRTTVIPAIAFPWNGESGPNQKISGRFSSCPRTLRGRGGTVPPSADGIHARGTPVHARVPTFSIDRRGRGERRETHDQRYGRGTPHPGRRRQ